MSIRRPTCITRMRELRYLPGTVTKAIAAEFPNSALSSVANLLGVTPEQLLLYHEGTKSSPGIAALYRQRQELQMTRMLAFPGRRPFRFRSTAEFQWFVVMTRRLWVTSGASLTAENDDEEHWFRGYALPSFQDYLAEIAWYLRRRREGFINLRKELLNQDPPTVLKKVALHRWRRLMDQFAKTIANRDRADSSFDRWMRRGRERNRQPGWHLKSLGFDLDDLDPAQPTCLTSPASDGKSKYIEFWERTGGEADVILQGEAWIILEERTKIPDECEAARLESRVRAVMRNRDQGMLELRQHLDSPTVFGIGPVPTRRAASRLRRSLDYRGITSLGILEIKTGTKHPQFVINLGAPSFAEEVLFDAKEHQPNDGDSRSPSLVSIDAALRAQSLSECRVDEFDLGASWQLRVGPFTDSSDCKSETRYLRNHDFPKARYESSRRRRIMTFHNPASPSQFRVWHRTK